MKYGPYIYPMLAFFNRVGLKWDYCRWERELSQHIVFVTTPDTLKNALSRGYIKMEKVYPVICWRFLTISSEAGPHRY